MDENNGLVDRYILWMDIIDDRMDGYIRWMDGYIYDGWILCIDGWMDAYFDYF